MSLVCFQIFFIFITCPYGREHNFDRAWDLCSSLIIFLFCVSLISAKSVADVRFFKRYHIAMIISRAFLAQACLFKEYLMSSNCRRLLSTKLKPIKLSYTSYESSVDGEKKTPLIIMHGLFGCKSNWNSLSNALHRFTRRKVSSWVFTVIETLY